MLVCHMQEVLVQTAGLVRHATHILHDVLQLVEILNQTIHAYHRDDNKDCCPPHISNISHIIKIEQDVSNDV